MNIVNIHSYMILIKDQLDGLVATDGGKNLLHFYQTERKSIVIKTTN